MNANRRRVPQSIIPLGVVAVAVAVVVILAGPDEPQQQNVVIRFPNDITFEMDVSQPEIEHSDYLTNMFKDQFVRDGVLGWLARNQQVYSISNPDLFDALKKKHIYSISDLGLVEALEKHLCDTIPDYPLTERIHKGQECAEKPVAAGLRQLQMKRRKPFHYVGFNVRIGVQADGASRPASGRANVCKDGGLLGKQLELIDSVSNNVIVVQASGWYTCSGYTRYPDVQLAPDQASTLFNRTLDEYQEAIAVLLN